MFTLELKMEHITDISPAIGRLHTDGGAYGPDLPLRAGLELLAAGS